ncbi:MAG: hypothetical protein QOK43_1841 [Acidimicrobiaceae bacterium]|nr:hypothetical protein [Acidimicrobiaceae bacterium]
MSDWGSVPVTGSTTLPPDPGVMKAIGLNHALPTAIADLVDNSVDAGATTVLVRFVRDDARLLGVYVVDDGRGMDESTLDRAMTVGSRRDYDSTALGHFGIGLKAASLGQAAGVTVISRADGPAVGRRWTMQKAADSFECEIVSAEFATATMDTAWGPLTTQRGTVVRWDGVKEFPGARNAKVVERYLETTLTGLRQHLGLVFHRLLEERRFSLLVDIHDVAVSESGPPFLVDPIDPFAYVRSGHPAYPCTLTAELDGAGVELRCHIWPGRSQLPGFHLSGTPERHQGFFFYRRGRLLQDGGWNAVTHPEKHLQLARVAVDIDDHPAAFTMNPEKTRVETASAFAQAVDEASGPGGENFADYLRDAEGAYRDSRKRSRSRPRVVPPGRGFAPALRRAIGRELEYLAGEEPIEILWGDFKDDSFFDVDREARTVWVNKRYRAAVLGGRGGSLNDAPVVKALLYLLVEDLFRGAYLGAKDRDNVELWRSVLTAAAKEETG